jgi:cysteine-S-conjugate beta-lyase
MSHDDSNHDHGRHDRVGLSTQLIHHPYRPPEGFAAPNVGVHKASSVFFDSVAQMRSRTWLDRSGYTYGLHGTPTTFTLEARLATLEGARHCMLAPSGLAAIAIVNTALLRQGDHVLLPDNVYQPNLAMARHELTAWGITHALYDAMDAAALEAALTPSTKLVWLEAAGSVSLEFPDLVALVKTVRAKAPQAVVALDNTWGAGIAFAPFDLPDLRERQGVDVCVHALTKYPSGGGDVLMGSVTCRDDTLYARLAMTHSRLGIGVGANDVEFVLRALPTLELRYRQHDAATREVAKWLATRAEFARVLHPALPGSPGHDAWKKLCDGAAGLVGVQFAPDVPRDRVDAFVDALRLFRIGYSWGGPMSLAVPYDLAPMRPKAAQPRGMLVRFSIGLEAPKDLIADLEQAICASLGR